MKIVLSTLCLLLAPHAFAAEGLPAFGSISFSQLRQTKSEIAVPRAKAGDVLSAYHMLAQAGTDSLYGFAENETEAAEAISYWSRVLIAAGVTPGAPVFEEGSYRIPYKSADGRVIRDFLADSRQFPPKDEAGLRANMAFAKAALVKAGADVVATHVVNVDVILPTYSIMYLTRSNELPEHETRLRVLKPGNDIDVAVYGDAGVNVIQTPETWMMVYIGPEVGYVRLFAKTAEDLDVKIARRREYLAGEGKKFIAERRMPLDDAEYKFGAGLYFFQ